MSEIFNNYLSLKKKEKERKKSLYVKRPIPRKYKHLK